MVAILIARYNHLKFSRIPTKRKTNKIERGGGLKEDQDLQQYLKPSHLEHSPVISLYEFVATSFCLFPTILLPSYAS